MTRRMIVLLNILFIGIGTASAYFLEQTSLFRATMMSLSGISLGFLMAELTDVLVKYRHARRLNVIMNLSRK